MFHSSTSLIFQLGHFDHEADLYIVVVKSEKQRPMTTANCIVAWCRPRTSLVASLLIGLLEACLKMIEAGICLVFKDGCAVQYYRNLQYYREKGCD